MTHIRKQTILLCVIKILIVGISKWLIRAKLDCFRIYTTHDQSIVCWEGTTRICEWAIYFPSMAPTLRRVRRSSMEILLPHHDYHTFHQSTTTSSSTIHHYPAQEAFSCVYGTMHRATTPANNDDSNPPNYPPESDSDDNTSSRVRTDEVTLYVQVPLAYDVLGSHDRNANNHPGNQVYRKMIEENAASYKGSKQEKMNFTRAILSTMVHRYGSRFLRSYSDSSLQQEQGVSVARRQSGNDARRSGYNTVATWQVMTDKDARDKISHALRTYNKNKKQNDEQKDGTTSNSTTRGRNEGIGGAYGYGGNNADNPPHDANVAVSASIEMGHARNDMESIGLLAWDDSFDDGNISLSDSNALIGLFQGGGGSMASSPMTLNTSNEIHYEPEESMNRKPKSTKRMSKTTGKATTKKRKGSYS